MKKPKKLTFILELDEDNNPPAYSAYCLENEHIFTSALTVKDALEALSEVADWVLREEETEEFAEKGLRKVG